MVSKRITRDWKAISIDGSAFDSSQFRVLMQMVDDKFWLRMRPYIWTIVAHNFSHFIKCPEKTIDVIVD